MLQLRPYHQYQPHAALRGGRFDPVSLFGGSDNGGVWDASDVSSLWQASGGTTAVAATGDPVGRITDLSGRGTHLTQATSGARAPWNDAGYIEFDGVNHYIWNNNTVPYTQAQTWVMAFESEVTGATRTRLFGRDALHALNDTADEAVWYAQTVSSAVATIDRTARGYPNVFTFVRESGTVAKIYWSGQLRATFDPTDSSTPTSIVIGADTNTGANKGALKFYAGLLINRALSDSERAKAERWAETKISAHRFPKSDIVAIAGQSNTYYGTPLDAGIDVGGADIYEFAQNGGILLANDPLDTFVGRNATYIGFAMEFAREYIAAGRLTPGNKLLLVHCGYGGTGFSSAAPNTWSEASGSLRERTINRVNAAMKAAPGSTVKALLWHQGETDALAGAPWVADHESNLADLFSDLRSQITGAGNVPIVVGELAPTWVANNGADAAAVQAVLTNAAATFDNVAVAPSTSLTVYDGLHFDAASQRTLGERYFDAYEALI